jgi:molecular chaperone GrpE
MSGGREREGEAGAERPAAAEEAEPLKADAPGSAGADVGDGDGAEAEAEQVEQDIAQVLDTARRERDEYLDMLRRVQADFENYKKRMVRQQTDLLERAAEGLVGRLLPVLDAFELARAHLEEEGSPEGKALLQAATLLSDTLAKEGLERVDAEGASFDPTVHEAVEHQPAADDGGEGEAQGPVVTDVLRAGYRYKGRVVRPAMVRVQG